MIEEIVNAQEIGIMMTETVKGHQEAETGIIVIIGIGIQIVVGTEIVKENPVEIDLVTKGVKEINLEKIGKRNIIRDLEVAAVLAEVTENIKRDIINENCVSLF